MRDDRTHLRRFGLAVGGVFVAIALWLLLRSGGTSPTGVVLGALGLGLVLLGLAVPLALRPAERAWGRLAQVLGWINTRILLAAVFYSVFTLTRLFLLLFRKDPLHRRPDSSLETYWNDLPAVDPEPSSYENPF